MKNLIVSATKEEIVPLLKHLELSGITKSGLYTARPKVDLLISGIGQTATAFQLGKTFANSSYQAVWNFGIAGSFSQTYPKTSVVHIVEEAFADIGAENADGFLDLFEMGLMDSNCQPFVDGKLSVNTPHLPNIVSELPTVRAVTVNRVLARRASIDWIKQKYNPEIVSMEGAAVFYACALSSVPCAQIRAISDFVSENDRAKWDIAGAIAALNKVAIAVVNEL